MEIIRKQLQNPTAVGVSGLILGILLGLLYAWVISPVEWVDAPVNLLRQDLKEDYLRMTVDSYASNKDTNLALRRFAELDTEGEGLLNVLTANPGTLRPEVIAEFRSVVGAPASPAVAPAEPASATSGGLIRTLLPAVCFITLLLAGGLVVLFLVRNRGLQLPTRREEAPKSASPARPSGGYAAPAPSLEEAPLVQFMATYKVGDDLFDDSFSVDSPSGEFLGECGVSISETIGVGEPKKVTAFEIWLFDKYDIETVTKVVMSAHAFLDETIRQRLAAKGEPVLAEPGGEVVLETQSLRMVARIMDMTYGNGAVPESSFFERLILELAIWAKK